MRRKESGIQRALNLVIMAGLVLGTIGAIIEGEVQTALALAGVAYLMIRVGDIERWLGR